MCTICKDIDRHLEREPAMQVNMGREKREQRGRERKGRMDLAGDKGVT